MRRPCFDLPGPYLDKTAPQLWQELGARMVGKSWTGSRFENYLAPLPLVKGASQRQNKLISSERPFEILQNEIKIYQAVLEIFNFKDLDLDSFPRKNNWKPKIFCRSFAKTKKQ